MAKTNYLERKTSPSMAESIAMSLLTGLGLPLFIFGWISNLDSAKSWLAFIVGGCLLVVRAVFFIDKLYHQSWLRRMERKRMRKEWGKM